MISETNLRSHQALNLKHPKCNDFGFELTTLLGISSPIIMKPTTPRKGAAEEPKIETS